MTHQHYVLCSHGHMDFLGHFKFVAISNLAELDVKLMVIVLYFSTGGIDVVNRFFFVDIAELDCC